MFGGQPYLENSWFGTSLVPRDQTGRAQMQIATIQCSRAQCMRMSSIDMGLDYDSTVMLTCKLLFAAAKSAPALMSYVCWNFFFFKTKGGGG